MISLWSSRTCPEHPPRLPRRARGWLLGCALSAALAGACGGQSLSTDTGNPPVVGQKLHLTATATGVLVTGEPGAVPGGARVDVINTATAQTASTTAADDGSFQVELEGSGGDELRVYVGSGQQSWRARLTSGGTSAPETGIEGRDFLLSSAQGYTLVAGTQLRVSFDDNQLTFNAGCNTASGTYSLCQERLCVADLATTDIGCDSQRHTQDEWLADFFVASPRLSIAGATLTLEGASATLELLDRELADPDRPLTGRVWRVDTFFAGDVASSVPLVTPPTLEFNGDGTFRVFDGCNGGSAEYTRSGQTLSLAPVAFTEIGCPGDDLPRERIQELFRPGGEMSVEIEANRLQLKRGASGLGALTD